MDQFKFYSVIDGAIGEIAPMTYDEVLIDARGLSAYYESVDPLKQCYPITVGMEIQSGHWFWTIYVGTELIAKSERIDV